TWISTGCVTRSRLPCSWGREGDQRMTSQVAPRSMYERILVTLDGTASDRAIIEHVKKLAVLAHSRLILLHVADGWAARTYGPDAVSREISEDTTYLHK